MRRLRRLALAAVAIAMIATVALAIYAAVRRHPQDLPWTPLTLDQPIGAFTGRKLAALGADPGKCRALLDRAGIRYVSLPALRRGQCGYDDAVRLDPGGARRIALSPRSVGMACPVAAALAMWEWDVVQPAAQARLGARVVAIEHYGSYNCRRMYGREGGAWSEHAHANAIDIAGFRLADGRRLTIARDWRGAGSDAAFLHDVRDGACRLYATVLSPDYNAAHRDHLHLDQADRGKWGWRACR